jgi:hypothetical protein
MSAGYSDEDIIQRDERIEELERELAEARSQAALYHKDMMNVREQRDAALAREAESNREFWRVTEERDALRKQYEVDGACAEAMAVRIAQLVTKCDALKNGLKWANLLIGCGAPEGTLCHRKTAEVVNECMTCAARQHERECDELRELLRSGFAYVRDANRLMAADGDLDEEDEDGANEWMERAAAALT